jgi:hypothetical protein
MAGTALTDLNAVSTAVSAADQSLGLATGVNITDQVNAIKVRVQETALMVADLSSLAGLSGGLTAALATVATDLT